MSLANKLWDRAMDRLLESETGHEFGKDGRCIKCGSLCLDVMEARLTGGAEKCGKCEGGVATSDDAIAGRIQPQVTPACHMREVEECELNNELESFSVVCETVPLEFLHRILQTVVFGKFLKSFRWTRQYVGDLSPQHLVRIEMIDAPNDPAWCELWALTNKEDKIELLKLWNQRIKK